MSARLIDKILREVSLDSRIHDGIFKLEENDHMEVMREYLINKGIDEASVIEFCNKVLEGKYPERQAYNKDGILVTFPTPEYKKKAILAGTHFEEDPTKRVSNLFQTPSGGGKKDDKPESEKPKAGGQAKTQLPLSQAPPPKTEPQTLAPQPQTTSAPMPTPEPQSAAPVPEPTELPPVPQKSPQEKEAEKRAIKIILKSDDYMLEKVVEYLINPSISHYSILEEIRKRL